MTDHTNNGCSCTPNTSIRCAVTNCANHCKDAQYCGLNAIQVGTHEANPTMDQLVYAFRGALPLGEALPYLVGGLAGGWIGGRLFKDVPNTWLKRIFALFLLYGAVRYLL